MAERHFVAQLAIFDERVIGSAEPTVAEVKLGIIGDVRRLKIVDIGVLDTPRDGGVVTPRDGRNLGETDGCPLIVCAFSTWAVGRDPFRL